jgi:hypothetical protein
MEKYRNAKEESSQGLISENDEKDCPKEKRTQVELETIASLPDNHYAKDYLRRRMIPEDKLNILYFAEDFAKFVNSIRTDGKYSELKAEPGIVIPFFDQYHHLMGAQSRSFNNDRKFRYQTVSFDDEHKLVYGCERLDKNKTTFITEGPLDSLFLDNSLAAASSSMDHARDYGYKDKTILVFDNEPRNKEIVKLMAKQILDGYRVCIWPDYISEKDINDMVMAGNRPSAIQDTIIERSFSGIRASLELNSWKKV